MPGGGGLFGMGFGPDFGFDLFGGGGRAAAGQAAAGQDSANRAYLEGMDRSIAAQREGFGNASGALSPYAQRGLGYMDQYANMAMNPNLDAIRKEREDATNNLNAQLASMGMHNSGFAGRQHGMLQADYAARMFNARMQAMQPLLGVGPQAAGGLANAAMGLGSGMGAAYQQGYGAYGQGMGALGGINAQGTMAPYQTFGSLLGPAAAIGGAAIGGSMAGPGWVVAGGMAGSAVGGSLAGGGQGGYGFGGQGAYPGVSMRPRGI